ncbi:uncharacterized protein LOC143474522 [Brachyhypopomus gauderio]|uniref:uncharacterized protein LOC143474522 n=1 Tax=Brachyhypopomus gauderio TaxID=698409 RepID=UPI00404227A2
MDELATLTQHQREYCECSLLMFTETWLTALGPDTVVSLDGFHLIRVDRTAESDHNLVHLLPVYKPLVHREPAVTRTEKKWTTEADEALKDCFSTTLWEELCDPHGDDIEGLTHCITDYVNFCVENTVPTRSVRCFSNNKPWINSDIKTLLKEKKRVFRSGHKEEMKSVQTDLRRKIREGKTIYRRKMEDQLQQNNVSRVWNSLNTTSGHKKSDSQWSLE